MPLHKGRTRGKKVHLDIPITAPTPMERAPIDPDLPTVAGLWIGGTLSFLEQLCLLSFRDHGHRTVLYTYHGVDRVPEGIEVRDANKVMPTKNYITHKNSASPALHSDVFRYHMIQQTGFVWIDADVLCVRPWRMPTQYLFGWEKPPKLICGAVLGLPQDSPGLQALLKFCEDEYPIPPWAGDEERAALEAAHEAGKPVHVTDLKWGVWGPSALTHFLYQSGEVDETLSQPAFYPISFRDRRDLLKPNADLRDRVGPECLGVHLWNRRISRRIVADEVGLPHHKSLIGKALFRHRVDPRLAPIPDKPPPGSPTQVEALAGAPAERIEALMARYRRRAAVYGQITDCANGDVAGEIVYPKGSLADRMGLSDEGA